MLNAMILAAGRGERLKPLTDHVPKPLVSVAGQSLILRHLNQLEKIGIDSAVINCAWLGEYLQAEVKRCWSEHALPLYFSDEKALGLETAGGIVKALPLLSDPFLLINGDIFTEFDFAVLREWAEILPESIEGRLVLVNNPIHHLSGDFALEGDTLIKPSPITQRSYTFSGISVLRHSLFKGYLEGHFLPLRDVLNPAICRGSIEGAVTDAYWMDVGTLQRLQELRQRYADNTPLDQP
jgi:N-acetyl-alpha-D-muramate 1-phosphate uridylyltransferase